MNQRFRPLSIFCLAFSTALTAAPPAVADDTEVTFEQHVRPIFKVYCLDCHGGGQKVKGKLDLRLRPFAVRGGKSGTALLPGYADSNGDGAQDTPRPYAWKYRDYVIRSLNADKPLDRFLIEQLAGDELVPRPWSNVKREQIKLLTATGFLRTAPDGTSSGGSAEAQQQVADTLKIVSSSLLGLTVGCAQCHDHKYDPIPQADYYRLRAVFEPAFDPAHFRRPAQRLASLYTEADRARAAAVEAEAAKMQKDCTWREAIPVS